MRLQGKVALITGAANGIGNGIARAFAREGCAVAIADWNAAGAETAAEAIRAAGGKAVAIEMDVADEAQVDAGFDRCVSALGRLDIMVCNAGNQIVAPMDQFDFADWKKIMAVQMDGAFLTTRAALRLMYRQGTGGSIIYTGSVHSKEASALKGPYVAAKHGILGLAKVVAKEGVKHGVRANVICPGYVRTALVEKQIPEQAERFGISERDVIEKILLKDTVDAEFTTIEDVAAVALFFAEFETNALTGQSLNVSHGWSMR